MINGFLTIDKEREFTSRDVDSLIKRELDVKKDGHLGTLDPFATGLLIVAINEATKVLSLVNDDTKEYEAVLKLGEETDTLDCTGKVIKESSIPNLSPEEIQNVLISFKGKSNQNPPIFSAKHIDGRRAYSLARGGDEVNLPPLPIEIFDISLMEYNSTAQEVSFRVSVSKGTYIRALGRDIASRLNTVGYLTSLRRTRIGNIDLSKAVKVREVKSQDVISISDFLPDIPSLEVKDKTLFAVLNGNPVHLNETAPFVFLKSSNVLLSVYQRKDNEYISYRGFKHE